MAHQVRHNHTRHRIPFRYQPFYRRFQNPGVAVPGDIVICKPQYPAIDFTTANIGGSKTNTAVNGVSRNELLFKMSANGAPSVTPTIQYAKAFVCDHSTTGQALGIYLWLANSASQMTALDYPSAICTGPSTTAPWIGENQAKYISWSGFIAGPAPQTSLMSLNANNTDIHFCVEQFLTLTRATLCLQSDGSITAADNDIQLWWNGAQQGIIPQGYTDCNLDISLGIGGGANDSQTIANASVAPAGVSFSAPNSYSASSIVIPGLSPGDGWPIWLKWNLSAQSIGVKSIQVVIGMSVDDGGSG